MTRRQIKLWTILLLFSASLQANQTVTESNASSTSNAISGQAVQGQNQGFTFAPVTTTNSTYNNRTISPVIPNSVMLNYPQNFLDPGVSASAMADPLVWYYLDAIASQCENEPELEVTEEKWVTISYQPDCGIGQGVGKNSPVGEITPRVDYAIDFDANTAYVPLGIITVQGNWDNAENVNLLTLLKTAQTYIKNKVKGFDRVIVVNDILKRTVSTQRAAEADSTGYSISPSISAGFGRDALVGSIFGFGQSVGTSKPVSRKGATFVVAAVSPGPWFGKLPKISQKDYFAQMVDLPKQINAVQPPSQSNTGNDSNAHPPILKNNAPTPPVLKNHVVNPVLKKPVSKEMSEEDIQQKALNATQNQ